MVSDIAFGVDYGIRDCDGPAWVVAPGIIWSVENTLALMDLRPGSVVSVSQPQKIEWSGIQHESRYEYIAGLVSEDA